MPFSASSTKKPIRRKDYSIYSVLCKKKILACTSTTDIQHKVKECKTRRNDSKDCIEIWGHHTYSDFH